MTTLQTETLFITEAPEALYKIDRAELVPPLTDYHLKSLPEEARDPIPLSEDSLLIPLFCDADFTEILCYNTGTNTLCLSDPEDPFESIPSSRSFSNWAKYKDYLVSTFYSDSDQSTLSKIEALFKE